MTTFSIRGFFAFTQEGQIIDSNRLKNPNFIGLLLAVI